MSNYKKLGNNVIILTIGNFSSKILTFLLVPLYTAILTLEEYGQADLITTTINLILPIFTMLIYEAVMRYALENSDRNQLFSWGFYITLLGALIVVLASPSLLLFEDFKGLVFLFSLYHISIAFYNLILQFLKGIEKVVLYAICGIVNTLSCIICNLLFLLVFDLRVVGYLLATIVSHFITALVAFVAAKVYQYLIIPQKLDVNYLKSMLCYSVPMIPNSISWWASNSLNKYILIAFCGIASNGLYSAANKIPTIVTIFVSIFIGAWQISSVEDFGSEKSKEFYSTVYKHYESVLFIVGSLMIFMVKFISKILLSNDFYTAWLYTPLLIYAFVLSSQASFFGSIYTASKKTKMLLFSTLIGALTNIILNLILVKTLGIQGATISTAAGYFVMLLVRIFDTRKILKIKIDYVKGFFANILILAEIFLVCKSNSLFDFYSPICVVLIALLYRSTVVDIIKKFLKIIHVGV